MIAAINNNKSSITFIISIVMVMMISKIMMIKK